LRSGGRKGEGRAKQTEGSASSRRGRTIEDTESIASSAKRRKEETKSSSSGVVLRIKGPLPKEKEAESPTAIAKGRTSGPDEEGERKRWTEGPSRSGVGQAERTALTAELRTQGLFLEKTESGSSGYKGRTKEPAEEARSGSSRDKERTDRPSSLVNGRCRGPETRSDREKETKGGSSSDKGRTKGLPRDTCGPSSTIQERTPLKEIESPSSQINLRAKEQLPSKEAGCHTSGVSLRNKVQPSRETKTNGDPRRTGGEQLPTTLRGRQ
jgi:hypothetical protein